MKINRYSDDQQQKMTMDTRLTLFQVVLYSQNFSQDYGNVTECCPFGK
jgi:hypothetical protein